MNERTQKSAHLIHTCPFSVRGGGEMNVRSILEATGEFVQWETFGVDDGGFYRNFIPNHIPMTNLGVRTLRYPSWSDIHSVLRTSTADMPLMFTANDTRTLGMMAGLRKHRPNLLYLWQCVPKRPDIQNHAKRLFIETRNVLSARTARKHLVFSPECAQQLTALGIQDDRIHHIPQLLNPACDRTLRSTDTAPIARNSPLDSLRILIVSRLTKTKGIHKLPHFLSALDIELENRAKRMSVTLIGNPSHGRESERILDEVKQTAMGLRRIRFVYDGYQPPQAVYEHMSNHDIALSLAGTEGYSVSLIEGLNMGLPHAVQPICAPNVDVMRRSQAGWILSGDVQYDAETIAGFKYDDPDIIQKRQNGYAFVDQTTGRTQFQTSFRSALFDPTR